MTQLELFHAPEVSTKEFMEHSAVLFHGRGIDPTQLADFQAKLAKLGQERFETVGQRDYGSGGRQKFEAMRIDDMVQGFLEEAADAMNYIAMASVKFLAGARFLDTALENACPE